MLALHKSFFCRSTGEPLAQHQSQLLPAFIWNEAQQPLHREKLQHAIQCKTILSVTLEVQFFPITVGKKKRPIRNISANSIWDCLRRWFLQSEALNLRFKWNWKKKVIAVSVDWVISETPRHENETKAQYSKTHHQTKQRAKRQAQKPIKLCFVFSVYKRKIENIWNAKTSGWSNWKNIFLQQWRKTFSKQNGQWSMTWRQWSWEQPTDTSGIMLNHVPRDRRAGYLAWKHVPAISMSNDFLFSHQTQCLLSTGHFIATILDEWGKHKQFSWPEVTRQWNAPAASWWNRSLHTEITSKVQALSSHINLTNWKNKLGSFRQEVKLPFYTSITHSILQVH